MGESRLASRASSWSPTSGSASGACGQEILARLRAGLGTGQAAERSVVRAELLKITRLRITKLLGL